MFKKIIALAKDRKILVDCGKCSEHSDTGIVTQVSLRLEKSLEYFLVFGVKRFLTLMPVDLRDFEFAGIDSISEFYSVIQDAVNYQLTGNKKTMLINQKKGFISELKSNFLDTNVLKRYPFLYKTRETFNKTKYSFYLSFLDGELTLVLKVKFYIFCLPITVNEYFFKGKQCMITLEKAISDVLEVIEKDRIESVN